MISVRRIKPRASLGSARNRPTTEVLEHRALLSSTGFTIDPSRSVVSFLGGSGIGDAPLIAQNSDGIGLVTSYQGTILATFANGGITFGGASAITALASGDFLPGSEIGGSDMTPEQADYGAALPASYNEYVAARRVQFTLQSAALPIQPDGTFDASRLNLLPSAGNLYYDGDAVAGNPFFDPLPMAQMTARGGGTVSDAIYTVSNGTATLILPVQTTLTDPSLSNFIGVPFDFQFEGQLVATASVGASASGAVTFTLDPARSSIALVTGSSAANLQVAPQDPAGASFTTTYHGTVSAALSGPSITFDGGSAIQANTSGSWLPGPDPDADPDWMNHPAPGNYGASVDYGGHDEYLAVRDLTLNLGSPAVALAGGTFDASEVNVIIQSGGLAYYGPFTSTSFDPPALDPYPLAQTLPNNGPRTGNYSVSDGIATLDIPIDVTLSGSVGLSSGLNITYSLHFAGQIIATANVTPSGGTIAGSVISDLNNNGTRDAGEPGLGDVNVYLDTNGNGQLDPGESTAVTAADGTYSFANLAPGTYTVRQVVPSGYLCSGPLGYAGIVTVSAGQAPAGPVFADVPLSSVHLSFSYLVLLAQHYGGSGTAATGDLNGDGKVNFSDLVILASHYNQALAATAASKAASLVSA